MSVDPNLQSILDDAAAAFEAASDRPQLADAKARFLGRDGALTQRMKQLGKASPEDRARLGQLLNEAKRAVEARLAAREEALEQAELDQRLAAEAVDMTLPGRRRGQGGLHPVSLVVERIERIFASIGFDVADGPEIEEDDYNFTALNTPADHPARSMHDTFYVDANDAAGRPLLLRTHTSTMQIRYARTHEPPIRVIAPGRTFRVDSDATHSPMFHQFEGLWIDENIGFADLKSMYLDFLRQFFERDDIEIRFRPSYFPFTEPSAEIDMRFAEGPLAGRWLEISGSGQVHPQVVRNFGLDPERWIGFAWGSGIERLAMLRYGVPDLRAFYENDLRFLAQFAV